MYLKHKYDTKDREMIKKAFSARQDLQYYTDRPVDPIDIEEIRNYCKDFFVKSKDIVSEIKEQEIIGIREKLRQLLN